jgi:hypothetical protein
MGDVGRMRRQRRRRDGTRHRQQPEGNCADDAKNKQRQQESAQGFLP